ncbi:MAG: TMEM43 family protein [Verrucomicrobiales bacterium]
MAEYTETTNESWFSRITSSVFGIIFGFVLLAGSGIGLFWNEGRTVKEAAKLDEGEKVVITVPGDRVDPANEGKLVHVSAVVGTEENLVDEQFGVAAPAGAVRLNREVQMYQWDEDQKTTSHKNANGSTTKTTTYSYHKKWSSNRINSGNFKRSGYSNPSNWLASSNLFLANQARLGAFGFGADLVSRLSESAPVVLDPGKVKLDSLENNGRIEGDTIYAGADSRIPQIGDLRITFTTTPRSNATIVGQQAGETFKGYMTKVQRELLLVSSGEKSSQVMFAEARTANALISWAIRVGGFIVMWIGLGLIMGPLTVLADIIPFLGSIVGAGTKFIAGVLAFVLSTTIIAVGWFASRPLLGISLVVVAVGLIVWLVIRNNKKKQQQTPPALSSPPALEPPPLNM